MFSSTEDCAQRANCPAAQGADSDGTDAAASPEPDDATGASDVASEGTRGDAAGAGVDGEPGADVTVADASTADRASLDGPARMDSAAEAPSGDDATPDVVGPDDGPIEASSACVPTGPENCTNGVDDDCNGLVDCADPACGAYTCAAPVPAGWSGPIAWWQGSSGATAPGCAAGFQQAFDANSGLSGAAATCSCSCTASGQVCSVSGDFHPDQSCGNAPCATVTPASSGACTAVPSNTCGSGGSFSVSGTPAPSGGTCSARVTSSVPPAVWAGAARACAYAGPADTGAGCAPAERCVAAPGAGGYGAKLCIYTTSATPPSACPAGYASGAPIVVYSGYTDTRGCGACACSGPSGGSCSGTIEIYGSGGCTGSNGSATYTLGTACQAYSGLSPVPGSVKASYVVTGGSCSVQSQPPATGAVTATGPTTVCCM
ncbi:MAG TPA: hypothetical protein VE987_17385 [Polyangiaceae bacterium]|nr:hypothetical protein [Polyangiaceae bacterium]